MDTTERMRRRAQRVPGLRTIRRPISWADPGAEAAVQDPAQPITGPEFALTYVRPSPPANRAAAAGADPLGAAVSGTGSPGAGSDGAGSDGAGSGSGVPTVVIPGGPGLASALPYADLRKRASARGLDLLMIEHRGVGLSRHDLDGDELPPEALEVDLVVDDIAAVLAAENIEQAVIVGSSYGSYIAQAFAVAHPESVAGLVLDSPMVSADDRRQASMYARDLLLHGTTGGVETRVLAAKIHDLVESAALPEEELGRHARILFEFAGPQVLDLYLNQVKVGRASRTRQLLEKLGAADTAQIMPCYMEFDLVGRIFFRELEAHPRGDGRIFDSTADFAAVRDDYPDFAGEPVDLRSSLPGFDFPVLVLSGDRDLRTPRPIAQEVVALVPGAVLVSLPEHGHSALDTHQEALLHAIELMQDAVGAGSGGGAGSADGGGLGGGAGSSDRAGLDPEPDGFSRLKRIGGPSAQLGRIISASLTLDRLLS